ncbi:MAG TPA: flagellar basal body P-ring protein FlgI [Acetobacteraceae bacterium]|nr:flagellar basal body P-ring protein FlgI [Acetobacteraceae bacterium]
MTRLVLLLAALLLPSAAFAETGDVRVKELGRFLGWRENALVGYGIVTGLAGSGDSPHSAATQQALSNVLSRLGTSLPPDVLQSRNVAAVIVTATLPPDANVGDKIDATVTSIGDARSLVGGTLLMTPLLGADRNSYALAQGALVVGGYHFEDNLNLKQKNYPTSGTLSAGATVELPVHAELLGPDRRLTFVLKNPDFTTAERIADGLNRALDRQHATVASADRIFIQVSDTADANSVITQIEGVTIRPDQLARVVINERSGTVVAGGPVQISSVVISQGDIKVSVTTDNQASQPYILGGYAPGARSLIVTNSKLEVSDAANDAVIRFPNTTIADLVMGLNRAKVSTRGIIAILEAIKAAGALQADIIVQ